MIGGLDTRPDTGPDLAPLLGKIDEMRIVVIRSIVIMAFVNVVMTAVLVCVTSRMFP